MNTILQSFLIRLEKRNELLIYRLGCGCSNHYAIVPVNVNYDKVISSSLGPYCLNYVKRFLFDQVRQ